MSSQVLDHPLQLRPDGEAVSPAGRGSGHIRDAGLLYRARHTWREMRSPITGQRVPGTVPVFVLGVVAALAAACYWVPTGLSMGYTDAQSHLTIARRLFDTASNPGLAQLGTVWLPAPHLLLAPWVWSLWMWRTGWGGALLGAGCLGTTACSLYRAAARWRMGLTARMVVVLAVIANPSLLYLSTTALTEPVLIAAMAACLAGLAHAATRRRSTSGGGLAVYCGIPAAVAVLSRYEGWALVVTGSLLVSAFTWRRTRSWRRVAATVFGFCVVPVLAIGWWVGFNWVVFRDPLAFFSGPYSANAQQSDILARGLSAKGSLSITLTALSRAVESSVGPWLLAVAAVGLALALARRAWGYLVFVAVAATNVWFLIVALYLGEAIIWNSSVGMDYAWNNRFGMAAILAAALLCGYPVHVLASTPWRRWVVPVAATLCGAILGGQAVWFLQSPASRSLIIREAEVSRAASQPSLAAGDWLRGHWDGGQVLIDETVSDNAILPSIGIPLRNMTDQATDTLFTQALADPAAHAEWVWVSTTTSDAVRRGALRSPAFGRHFGVVYHNSVITIYRRQR